MNRRRQGRDLITPQRLRERLRYDPESGKLFWRDCADMPNNWRARFAGVEAFKSINPHGYRNGTVENNVFLAHRVIWAMIHGEWPDGQVDHIDGNRQNNRLDNLRVVTNQENARNSSLRSDNTSGVMGVSWHNRDKRWVATIKDGTGKKRLGSYRDFDEAVAARKAAEKDIGFHANHGRIRA